MKLFKITHNGYDYVHIVYVCAKSFVEAPEEFLKLTGFNENYIQSVELIQEVI